MNSIKVRRLVRSEKKREALRAKIRVAKAELRVAQKRADPRLYDNNPGLVHQMETRLWSRGEEYYHTLFELRNFMHTYKRHARALRVERSLLVPPCCFGAFLAVAEWGSGTDFGCDYDDCSYKDVDRLDERRYTSTLSSLCGEFKLRCCDACEDNNNVREAIMEDAEITKPLRFSYDCFACDDAIKMKEVLCNGDHVDGCVMGV